MGDTRVEQKLCRPDTRTANVPGVQGDNRKDNARGHLQRDRSCCGRDADKVRADGLDIPATDRDYFTFAAQQVLFVRLCGGDPDSLEGGDPEIGNRLVRNYQHIIDHYWRGNTAPSGGGES